MQYRLLAGFMIIVCATSVVPALGQGQASSLPAKDQAVYPGYFWGAAGIADTLIQILNSSILDDEATTLGNEILQKAVNGIWSSRMKNIYNETITAWQKTTDTEIYPGKKYGAAGIIDFFLNLYDYTGNSTYIQWANMSIYEIYKEAEHFELPHWSYSYTFSRGAQGVYITDRIFGSMGIIDTTLNVYEYTGDLLLLELAENATRWVYNNSNPVSVEGIEGRIIPWYSTNEPVNNSYTTYGWGNAGALPVLTKLADHTNSTKWENWAEFILSWLIDVQKDDGSWVQSPVDTDGISTLDFENGVTGTLFGLYSISDTVNSSEVDTSIARGKEWLLDQFIANETHSIFPITETSQSARYSLYQGMTGVNMVLRKLGDTSEIFQKSVNWVLENAIYSISHNGKQLLGMYPSTNNEDYVDLSYSHGLSGVILELLKDYLAGHVVVNTEIFNQFLNTLDRYQNERGLWPRQFDLPIFAQILMDMPVELVLIGGLTMIGVLVYYRRSQKLDQ